MFVEIVLWTSVGLSGDSEYAAQASLMMPGERVNHTIQMGYSQGSSSEYLAVREALRDLRGRVNEEQQAYLTVAIADPVGAITDRRKRTL